MGLLAALALGSGAGDSAAQTAKEMARFGSWAVFSNAKPEPRVCFAAAQPTSSEPVAANRSIAFFYVTAWPREGVKSEPSVKGSAPFRKGTPVTISIGNIEFALFTADDKAFVADAKAEARLVEAMRKGTTLIVRGTTATGAQLRDTYSLTGAAEALGALAKGCG